MDLALVTGGPDETAGRSATSPRKSFWKHTPVLRHDLEHVQEVITGVAEESTESIRAALVDTVANTGKMLRPALVLLSARSGRREPGRRESGRRGLRAIRLRRHRVLPPIGFSDAPDDKMYRMAAAIEILHMATLVHDDVIDGAEQRRGAPSVHTVHGNRRAILMGDLLFSSCFSLLSQDATMENAQLLASGVTRICQSQIDESLPSGGPKSPREYYRQVAAKTALLFMLSCHVGASESGVIRADQQALRRFGYNLGMAFQVVDDLLDLTGTEEELGKPIGTDLKSGVLTLPVLYALERDDGRLAQALRGTVPARRVPEVVAMVRERGGIDRARTVAERNVARAARALETMQPSGARNTLSWLLELSLQRRS
jgi:heptaprenyl diphosphate synthase